MNLYFIKLISFGCQNNCLVWLKVGIRWFGSHRPSQVISFRQIKQLTQPKSPIWSKRRRIRTFPEVLALRISFSVFWQGFRWGLQICVLPAPEQNCSCQSPSWKSLSMTRKMSCDHNYVSSNTFIWRNICFFSTSCKSFRCQLFVKINFIFRRFVIIVNQEVKSSTKLIAHWMLSTRYCSKVC